MNILWILCYFYATLKITESAFYSVTDERSNSVIAGLSIYRKCAPATENFVFSPISLRIVYSILYQSSTGKTKNAIKKILFKRSEASNDSTYLNLQPIYLQAVLNSSSVSSVNKIYLKAGYSVDSHFNRVAKVFRASVEQISFIDSIKAANIINHWVRNMTHGLIKQTIEPATITPQTSLILINALYFKANWRVPFHKNDVVSRIFYDFHGSKHHIDFIVSKGLHRIWTHPNQGFHVLQLPYESKTKFSFWIILPFAGHTIKSILPHVRSKTLMWITANFTSQYTKIQIPIFNIQTKLDGKTVSTEMFKYREYQMLMGTHPLSLNLLKQETNFMMNTNGTEAASVTHAHIGLRGVRHGQLYDFIADRPFLFAVVRHGMIDPILFGHYVRP